MTAHISTLNAHFADKFYSNRKAFRTAVRRYTETHKLYYTNQNNHYYLVIEKIEYSLGYNDETHLSYVTTVKNDVEPLKPKNNQLPGEWSMTREELIAEINKIAGEYIGHGNVSILGLQSMQKPELIKKLQVYTVMIVYQRRYFELFAQQEVSPADSWKLGMQPDDEQPNWYREAIINRQRAANIWATGQIIE